MHIIIVGFLVIRQKTELHLFSIFYEQEYVVVSQWIYDIVF